MSTTRDSCPPLHIGKSPNSIQSIHDTLQSLYRDGWQRIGIVALVLDPDDKLLLLQHRGNDKIVEGMWGPLAETSVVQDEGSKLDMESPIETISRGFKEELGLEIKDDTLEKSIKGYFTMGWPVGINGALLKAFAICPVVHLDRESAESIPTNLPTDEIMSARFFNYAKGSGDGLPALLRPGTSDWLRIAENPIGCRAIGCTSLSALGLYRFPHERFPYSQDQQDAIFTEMFGENV